MGITAGEWFLGIVGIVGAVVGVVTAPSLTACPTPTAGSNQTLICPALVNGVASIYVSVNGNAYAILGQPASPPTKISCPTWAISNGQPLTGSNCTIQ